MDDRGANIEVTLAWLELGDSLLQLCAAMASSAVRTTRQQCTEGQRLARIVRVLDAEASQRATAEAETVA